MFNKCVWYAGFKNDIIYELFPQHHISSENKAVEELYIHKAPEDP